MVTQWRWVAAVDVVVVEKKKVFVHDMCVGNVTGLRTRAGWYSYGILLCNTLVDVG